MLTRCEGFKRFDIHTDAESHTPSILGHTSVTKLKVYRTQRVQLQKLHLINLRLMPIGERSSQDGSCSTQNRAPFVDCSVSVPCRIHCGAVYVGQTVRCLNSRLSEPSSSPRDVPSGRLALHVRDCGCTHIFHNTIGLQHKKKHLESTSGSIFVIFLR